MLHSIHIRVEWNFKVWKKERKNMEIATKLEPTPTIE